MPTARGWLTIATGIALWLSGRAFGSGPLEQIGFALVALVGIAAVVVASRRDDLRVRRRVAPARARAGQNVRVHLALHNSGRRTLPLLLLDDRLPLELAGHARFALAGLEADGDRDTSYEIRAPRRGRYKMGPLRVSYVDPFGLAATTAAHTGTTELLVHPRVERLNLPRDFGMQRSVSVSALRQLSTARGEDFYTMREYAQGDDLRRIHWPSTAKRGKPMIRQEETPWQTRATVILDDGHPGDTDAGAPAFERAVEAAASFCDLYHRSTYTFRLAGAHHPGIAAGRGTYHLHRCLDLLATIQMDGGSRAEDGLLTRLAELEMAPGAEGSLVVVSTALSSDAAVGISRCLRRFKQAVVLLYPPEAFREASASAAAANNEGGARDAVRLLRRAGIPTAILGPGETLSGAWATLAGGSRRAATGGDAWDRKRARA